MTKRQTTESKPEGKKDGMEIEAYVRVWCETLASVLGQIVGQTVSLEARTEQAPADTSGVPATVEVFLNITLAGALRGEQALSLGTAQARWLAGTLTGESAETTGADDPIELTPEQQEAVEEMFRQVAGRVATALKPSWGEVQIHVKAGGAPSWTAATTASFQSPAGTTPALALELQLSAALVAALRRPDVAAGAGGATPTPLASPLAGSTTESGEDPSPGSVNLDFLKDVPLDLTLRFGQRRMVLREILELGPGSVIELDRHLKEPVELLLDGQVLARGEVVVIQGCYGLRVTQIAARGGAAR
jgi:flagellar motor switch protein FliN/FliY